MIPGLSVGAEAALRTILSPDVTCVTEQKYVDLDYVLLNGSEPESQALGVQHVGGPEPVLAVTDPARPVGAIRIETHRPGVLLFIDNRAWRGNLHAGIRVLGADCALIFNDIGDGFAGRDIFMRSDRQLVFWGEGATAVSCNIEIEGDSAAAAIGDDALISNGVWLRNHGMHALHDLATGAAIGCAPVTTVLERHVWLGQDALLLGCERVGMGSVVGARSLVKGRIPPRVAVGGTPAKVLREGVSWGRDLHGMTAAERQGLGLGSVAGEPGRH
ncbi:MAG: acyltransferase [Rhodoblastus sp.]|uniref:acyltransferase n=1 Tax=Rhodoblastus sp. TaxID=1962975 RepID=UPI003FD8D2CA